MSSDPKHSLDSAVDPTALPAESVSQPANTEAAAAAPASTGEAEDTAADDPAAPRRSPIRIGSQRPGVPVPRIEPRVQIASSSSSSEGVAASDVQKSAEAQPANAQQSEAQPSESLSSEANATPAAAVEKTPAPVAASTEVAPKKKVTVSPKAQPNAAAKQPAKRVEVPNLRAELTPDLDAELQAALGGLSVDDLIETENAKKPPVVQLDLEARHRGHITQIHRDNVFVEMDGRNVGVLSLNDFAEEPQLGASVEVKITRFNADEGLYELQLPHAVASVSDWDDVAEGMVVEAVITAHNKGGLECEVNRLRGFIPASQISLYRVDDLEQFVGQRLPCVVTEANPGKRNLVLSHRGVLERQQAESKTKLLGELEVGQTREGIVRSLRDFGAFVDLGGVDGLIHVSQMSWDRVKHPSEVLEAGQKVKVKIEKIDAETGKISLAYRDLSDNPWTDVTLKYPVTATVSGTVSRIMEFGAFVRLEPGVEGLIHISELAHKRINKASDAVSEGQTVEVKVLAVDADAQRISLSLKALSARPEPAKAEPVEEPEDDTPPPAPKARKTPLKGGLGRSGDGAQFGLKW